MKDPRIEKLAHNLLTYSIDLKENDNILIEVLGEEGMPLAKELMRQAEQMKARPYFNIVNYELLRIMLENATEEKSDSTKISSVQIEIFETTVSLDAMKKAVRKSVKEKGLSGNIEIYLNVEERAAYYTVNGNGSPEYRIDLKTL